MQTKNPCASLTTLINNYVEGNISGDRQKIFADYLASDEQMENFVQQSKQGKQALSHAYGVVAADDFKEKLAERIAQDKNESSQTV